MKFKTIKDLHEAVASGKLDATKIEIVLDSYCTDFYYGPAMTPEGEEVENGIEVTEAGGYSDIEPLYKLLFPKSTVGWC